MKTIIFSVALMLTVLASSAEPGSITNIQIAQGTGAEERLMNIQFDLTGTNASYDISLAVSFDNGITFSHIAPAEVTGSLSVAPGTGIQLVWDGRQTYGAVYAENARIRITLTDWPRDTQTQVVEVTNPVTGRTWMDRNLGASRAATSSDDAEAFGDLYQWGRAADGHQLMTSGITTTLSDSDTPMDGDFIIGSEDSDWRSPQNDNLWQGVNGINNPCPPGFRLPTADELVDEIASWGANTFDSPLKLPLAGYRAANEGSLWGMGEYGTYWSSTVDDTQSIHLLLFSESVYPDFGSARASGHSVRCIKD